LRILLCNEWCLFFSWIRRINKNRKIHGSGLTSPKSSETARILDILLISG